MSVPGLPGTGEQAVLNLQASSDDPLPTLRVSYAVLLYAYTIA